MRGSNLIPRKASRGYTLKVKNSSVNPFFNPREDPLKHDRVLVFDTETTINQYQNFKIGYFQIYQEGYFQNEGLFYDISMLTGSEIKVFKEYTSKNNIPLYTLEKFIDKVFYPEVFGWETLCVGYNLPFDISRISKRVGDSKKQNKGGFTFTLSENRFNPPIIIKKMGDAYTFKLTSTKMNKGDIIVGKDADLVIFDPEKEKLLTEETLHEKAQWTPYKNQKITGWPEMTMSRGEIIVQNDEFLGKKGWGLFI